MFTNFYEKLVLDPDPSTQRDLLLSFKSSCTTEQGKKNLIDDLQKFSIEDLHKTYQIIFSDNTNKLLTISSEQAFAIKSLALEFLNRIKQQALADIEQINTVTQVTPVQHQKKLEVLSNAMDQISTIQDQLIKFTTTDSNSRPFFNFAEFSNKDQQGIDSILEDVSSEVLDVGVHTIEKDISTADISKIYQKIFKVSHGFEIGKKEKLELFEGRIEAIDEALKDLQNDYDKYQIKNRDIESNNRTSQQKHAEKIKQAQALKNEINKKTAELDKAESEWKTAESVWSRIQNTIKVQYKSENYSSLNTFLAQMAKITCLRAEDRVYINACNQLFNTHEVKDTVSLKAFAKKKTTDYNNLHVKQTQLNTLSKNLETANQAPRSNLSLKPQVPLTGLALNYANLQKYKEKLNVEKTEKSVLEKNIGGILIQIRSNEKIKREYLDEDNKVIRTKEESSADKMGQGALIKGFIRDKSTGYNNPHKFELIKDAVSGKYKLFTTKGGSRLAKVDDPNLPEDKMPSRIMAFIGHFKDVQLVQGVSGVMQVLGKTREGATNQEVARQHGKDAWDENKEDQERENKILENMGALKAIASRKSTSARIPISTKEYLNFDEDNNLQGTTHYMLMDLSGNKDLREEMTKTWEKYQNEKKEPQENKKQKLLAKHCKHLFRRAIQSTDLLEGFHSNVGTNNDWKGANISINKYDELVPIDFGTGVLNNETDATLKELEVTQHGTAMFLSPKFLTSLEKVLKQYAIAISEDIIVDYIKKDQDKKNDDLKRKLETINADIQAHETKMAAIKEVIKETHKAIEESEKQKLKLQHNTQDYENNKQQLKKLMETKTKLNQDLKEYSAFVLTKNNEIIDVKKQLSQNNATFKKVRLGNVIAVIKEITKRIPALTNAKTFSKVVREISKTTRLHKEEKKVLYSWLQTQVKSQLKSAKISGDDKSLDIYSHMAMISGLANKKSYLCNLAIRYGADIKNNEGESLDCNKELCAIKDYAEEGQGINLNEMFKLVMEALKDENEKKYLQKAYEDWQNLCKQGLIDNPPTVTLKQIASKLREFESKILGVLENTQEAKLAREFDRKTDEIYAEITSTDNKTQENASQKVINFLRENKGFFVGQFNDNDALAPGRYATILEKITPGHALDFMALSKDKNSQPQQEKTILELIAANKNNLLLKIFSRIDNKDLLRWEDAKNAVKKYIARAAQVGNFELIKQFLSIYKTEIVVDNAFILECLNQPIIDSGNQKNILQSAIEQPNIDALNLLLGLLNNKDSDVINIINPLYARAARIKRGDILKSLCDWENIDKYPDCFGEKKFTEKIVSSPIIKRQSHLDASEAASGSSVYATLFFDSPELLKKIDSSIVADPHRLFDDKDVAQMSPFHVMLHGHKKEVWNVVTEHIKKDLQEKNNEYKVEFVRNLLNHTDLDGNNFLQVLINQSQLSEDNGEHAKKLFMEMQILVEAILPVNFAGMDHNDYKISFFGDLLQKVLDTTDRASANNNELIKYLLDMKTSLTRETSVELRKKIAEQNNNYLIRTFQGKLQQLIEEKAKSDALVKLFNSQPSELLQLGESNLPAKSNELASYISQAATFIDQNKVLTAVNLDKKIKEINQLFDEMRSERRNLTDKLKSEVRCQLEELNATSQVVGTPLIAPDKAVLERLAESQQQLEAFLAAARVTLPADATSEQIAAHLTVEQELTARLAREEAERELLAAQAAVTPGATPTSKRWPKVALLFRTIEALKDKLEKIKALRQIKNKLQQSTQPISLDLILEKLKQLSTIITNPENLPLGKQSKLELKEIIGLVAGRMNEVLEKINPNSTDDFPKLIEIDKFMRSIKNNVDISQSTLIDNIHDEIIVKLQEMFKNLERSYEGTKKQYALMGLKNIQLARKTVGVKNEVSKTPKPQCKPESSENVNNNDQKISEIIKALDSSFPGHDKYKLILTSLPGLRAQYMIMSQKNITLAKKLARKGR